MFFSICTNDSIPDTLSIDRTYRNRRRLLLHCPAAPAISRVVRAAHEPPTESVPAARHDGWRATLYDAPFQSGHERTELAFAASARLLCGSRAASGSRNAESTASKLRSSQDGPKRSETTSDLACAKSFPSDTAGSSVYERCSPPRAVSAAPARLTACRRVQSDLFRKPRPIPTPAHSPRIASPVERSSQNNKTTRGGLLRTSLISAADDP